MATARKDMARIIFVDDDRANGELVRMLLEMDGFQVSVCPDVDKAALAANDGVDAFIIDCNLARQTNGVDLLKRIRRGETPAQQDIPVIMTSGDDRREAEAEEAGANCFLLKPYPPSVLSSELFRLLHKESTSG